MKNKKTIEKIQEFADNVSVENPVLRDIIPFNLQDVVVENNFAVNDVTMSDSAVDKVLSIIKVKPEFKTFAATLAQGDYAEITNKLKEAEGDVNLYGSLMLNPDYTYTIDDIFFKNEKKKQPDDMTGSIHIIKNICDTLAASDEEWKLEDINFNNTNSKYSIRLSNQSSQIEALKDDFWTQGHVFEFNSSSFSTTPYFERLVCTNGMTKQQLGFSTNIGKANFHNSKLLKVIQGSLTENNADIAKMIEQMAGYAKNNTISLREFYDYKKFFLKRGYDELAEKYFNDAPFYKAWGDGIDERSKIWQSTANTGINAYDFINLNTWIASHIKDTKILEEDAKALKIMTANTFCGAKYDCANIAPAVKVEFPHFKEME